MATPGPTAYSEIIWFKTTSTTGGKLIGLENSRTSVSDNSAGGQYDRMLYMDATGEVWFGVYNATEIVAHSAAGSERRQLAHGGRDNEHHDRHVALYRWRLGRDQRQ